MSGLARGLYESLVTTSLAEELERLSSDRVAESTPLSPHEAADRLALHLGTFLRRTLEDVPENRRVELGTQLVREALSRLCIGLASNQADRDAMMADQLQRPAQLLRAVLGLRPDGSPAPVDGPLIPLLDTTLLTNSPGEPRVGKQLETEVHSADAIDIVMAFVRRSGIRPFLPALREHVAAGRRLRLLTTTYTSSTEAAALDQIVELGGDVRVSYDTTSTRLHAKSWLFRRRSGFSTAYIGSSNLTHTAQQAGLEWNVRISGARNPDVIDKVRAVFEAYWQSGDFEPYDRKEFLSRTYSGGATAPTTLSPIDLRLYPFQERLLEQIALNRRLQNHRNLLVSATGTGKTVMAAKDYERLRRDLPRARLLFVAHRKEILEQSLATFRHALRDGAFGELWVDGERPDRFEHVFASIQSLRSTGYEHLEPTHYDVVIVDEFHHAAADSYDALLGHVRPVELLGMTATPERGDGLDILHWFGGNIAAELRLWDAIDQHRLVPFLYFGIHDGVDLREVPWRRGHGYDSTALTNVYTSNRRWARLVLSQLSAHVGDPQRARTLGFCVSVEHARFMARVFTEEGLPAAAVWGDSSKQERQSALADLAAGRIQVLFSVDLFNEGVDLPMVDTLLLLRPTDSPTLFLQQLGRGLRRYDGKTACTVLDFVGQHRKEYRMDRRLGALLPRSRRRLLEEVKAGFPFLPAGCHMELDAVASSRVIESIRTAIPTRFADRAAELRALARTQPSGDASLTTFLEECGMELEDVYSSQRTWSDLREAAGLPVAQAGDHEAELRRALGRMLHVDDPLRLDAWSGFLEAEAPPDPAALDERDRRLLRMLLASLVGGVVKTEAGLRDGAALLWRHPQVLAEASELFTALEARQTHLQLALDRFPGIPMRVHARYTRREILAACGWGQGTRVDSWQTGVRWVPDEQLDLLAFTLDKTKGQFSPTTRYKDYALGRDLIHWESQGVTREASETGQRYQHHAARGSAVLLFARETVDQKAFWFLGSASYVSHEGERPMAVTWRLDNPLPGDLYAAFVAAVA